MRDSEGRWLGGFIGKHKCNTVEESEAWAVIRGLDWAWEKGVKKVEVQSDSKVVCDWMQGNCGARGPALKLIERF